MNPKDVGPAVQCMSKPTSVACWGEISYHDLSSFKVVMLSTVGSKNDMKPVIKAMANPESLYK
jgi:hypothetical protein